MAQSGSGTGTPISPVADTRKGYAFNNPDTAANGGWGNIITPDEMRYVYAFGLPLVAPNGQTITDETLQWYIDNAIASLETELNFTIIKRQIRYRPPTGESRTLSGTYEWEDPYDFDPDMFAKYIFVKLRRRPVLEVQEIGFRNVINQQILNILSWIKINHRHGTLEHYPSVGALAGVPFYASPVFPNVAHQFSGKYPDAFYIDYTAGFETLAEFNQRHKELFNIAGMMSAINLLNDYGDGKTAGLASSSLGLAGISESFSTTMSATNAFFGARILQMQKQIKEFWKNNKGKYSGILFGVL